MKKTWLVFLHEYARHVFRKRFIFAVLSMPIFIIIIIGVGILAVVLQSNNNPVGYVDSSGLLAHPVSIPRENSIFSKSIDFIPYPDETQARAALDQNQIQAYYVLSPDYLQTSKAKLVSLKEPSVNVQGQFEALLRANLLASQPPDVAKRVVSGSELVIQSADGSRQMAQSQWANILVPVVGGLLFMMTILMSGSYLMHAVVEEKENRTMEIIVTSVSPDQLMAGKIMGNIGAGLTQVVIWVLFILIGLAFGQNSLGWAQNIEISPEFVGILLLAFVPAFFLVGGLMAAVGATVTESREAQQITGMFTLPIVAPYWFSTQIITYPNSPLAVGLSYFPLTAPVTLTLRSGFTQIPTLQLALNIAVLWLCAIAAIWFAARSFRIGMLSYGKRLSLRQILRRSG